MPIFVNGEILDDSCLFVSKIVEKYPIFETSAKIFRSQPARQVPSPGLLYVFQREYATVTVNDDKVTLMGSEDATTCHIVCIRNKVTGTSSLAHFDGDGMEDAIDSMVKSVLDDTNNEIDLHMFGGFLDDRQLSSQITQNILIPFHKNTAKINLCTFCVTDLNDTIIGGEHYPVVYGIAINLKSGELFHASFPGKGPDGSLRHLRSFMGERTVIQVYYSLTGELQIGPFSYKYFDHAPFFMNAPDDIILQYLSTSPHCEPTGFCDETRATMGFLVKNPKPLKTVFPDGTPHRYTRNSNNEWQPIV